MLFLTLESVESVCGGCAAFSLHAKVIIFVCWRWYFEEWNVEGL